MKWISVLDGLPTHSQEVIFCELVSGSQYVHHGYYNDDGDNCWYISFCGKISPNKVTHWHPITALPNIDEAWEIRNELHRM